jgi:hypothetical protein
MLKMGERLMAPGFYIVIDGERRLIGLSKTETKEFERLNQSSPFFSLSLGRTVAPATSPFERRWLELLAKHEMARAARLRASE